jgi:hypothetical protein
MVKNKFFVVAINRGTYGHNGFKVNVIREVASTAAGRAIIREMVLTEYEKRQSAFRRGSSWNRKVHVRMDDLRVVDEVGLKRLHAAAKADKTRLRKKAAQKAAKTRASRRVEPEYAPGSADYQRVVSSAFGSN